MMIRYYELFCSAPLFFRRAVPMGNFLEREASASGDAVASDSLNRDHSHGPKLRVTNNLYIYIYNLIKLGAVIMAGKISLIRFTKIERNSTAQIKTTATQKHIR